jgi:hypothetical protein
MLTLNLSRNAPAISSLTMSMAPGESPSAPWSSIGVGVWMLVCYFPTHWLGFCGPLMFALCCSYDWSSLSGFLGGAEKYSPPCVSDVILQCWGAIGCDGRFSWDGCVVG